MDFTVVVAGGYHEVEASRSVEFLYGSVQQNGEVELDQEWIFGPSLPLGINLAAMVEELEWNAVLLVGGADETVSNAIYRLNLKQNTWEKLPQKLQTPRYGHVAVLLPPEYSKYCHD